MQGLRDVWAAETRGGFDVYDVVVEDLDSEPPDADDAAEWQDSFALPWVVVYDAEGVTEAYDPGAGLPASWLLDRHGRVVWTHRGAGALEALQDALEDLP